MWRYVRGRSTRVMRADRSMVVVVLESGEERVEQNRLSWNKADPYWNLPQVTPAFNCEIAFLFLHGFALLCRVST